MIPVGRISVVMGARDVLGSGLALIGMVAESVSNLMREGHKVKRLEHPYHASFD
jgi:hypothetical protein